MVGKVPDLLGALAGDDRMAASRAGAIASESALDLLWAHKMAVRAAFGERKEKGGHDAADCRTEGVLTFDSGRFPAAVRVNRCGLAIPGTTLMDFKLVSGILQMRGRGLLSITYGVRRLLTIDTKAKLVQNFVAKRFR